jgi:hypothetical protein
MESISPNNCESVFQNKNWSCLAIHWGSIIATGMAQRRPDLFYAYVGTGQASSWADTVQFQFDFLKQRYKEKGDTAALAALEKIDKPDPKNVDQYLVSRAGSGRT